MNIDVICKRNSLAITLHGCGHTREEGTSQLGPSPAQVKHARDLSNYLKYLKVCPPGGPPRGPTKP